MRRRLSRPRAIAVLAVATGLAAVVGVSPAIGGTGFLANQKAGHLYLTESQADRLYLDNGEVSETYLKKKAAGNLYVRKSEDPYVPVVGIAAGTAPMGPTLTPTAGYIPGAFTSFATKGIAPAVISFTGNIVCTAPKPAADVACPIQFLVDGQATGKINIAPSTAESPAPVPIAQTAISTTVLGKGGHTVAVQYAGSSKATFTVKGWNLAVEAYPQLPEPLETDSSTGGGAESAGPKRK